MASRIEPSIIARHYALEARRITRRAGAMRQPSRLGRAFISRFSGSRLRRDYFGDG